MIYNSIATRTINAPSLNPLPESLNPSCLHATLASLVDQKSSQTVPQSLLLQISTRPSRLFDPSLSLMLPCVHTVSAYKQNDLR